MTRIPGEFVPLDVDYAHDRAIRQAGYAAEALFLRSIAYTRKHYPLHAGLIPDFELPTIAAGIPNPRRHAAALVRERLWIAVRGGWRIRSFEKWNPAVDRAPQRFGGVLGNHNRWHTGGRWSPDCEFCTPEPPDRQEHRPTDHPTDRPTDRSSIGVASLEEREERRDQSKPSSSSSLSDAREAVNGR